MSAVTLFSDLTSTQVHEAVRGKVLVWPIGGLEQHGPHLPLNVDALIPQAFAEALSVDVQGLLLPLLPISVRSLPQSGGGLQFPGTVFVEGGTFIDFIGQTLRSLSGLPYRQLVIINGHYENEGFIFEALDQMRQGGALQGRSVLAFSWWSMVRPEWVQEHLPEFPGWHAEHAGITETSLMLHLHPELVRAERPDHDRPPRAGVYQLPLRDDASNQGVLAMTSTASAEIGVSLFEHVREQIKVGVMDARG
ncbi:creatininase family protein [Pseudomonas sp. S75]|uniref:creatininase family protein n=1 Tax=unclassified Pseudomonas TaxID=196821 RepID=UPI001903A8A2|nr:MULTISPECIES: creatininase family protein [unclassified Pseudomonas]MBJ9975368.1 creatininase family protein [Pseudomonas sp. S30]MBK0152658.1 creatininase family protein [Pseudomonas sp. S75]